jgi:hypothetical protein
LFGLDVNLDSRASKKRIIEMQEHFFNDEYLFNMKLAKNLKEFYSSHKKELTQVERLAIIDVFRTLENFIKEEERRTIKE